MAATTLERSQSALGGFYRRMKARLGAAEAVTATAHKLARIIYRLIKYGEAYVRQGLQAYEKQFQSRRLQALQRTAKTMGFQLVPTHLRQEFLKRILRLPEATLEPPSGYPQAHW